ncbi:MAG: hypothetical protein RI907_3358 [Pseudomonadota bacterium]|jgi:myo-inositol-1(or 4)-monophosphatase
MSQALHPMLNIAIKAARAAGAIINRASLDIERLTITTKSTNDFVTEVDHAAEDAIIETILEAYPGHGILAEESGRERGARHSDYVWIIDPLDGTTNFIHGFPVYAVSIALTFRGQVQQAVVYDPARNDLFYASKGKGAFMNDRRIRVSKRTRLKDSLIGTGFPFRKGDNFQRYMKMFEAVMVECAGLRRPGAAALDLCYVAAGFYDGFFETGLSPWDIAAGSLIITEAGGLVGNFTGEPDFLYQREIVAGTPRVYGQLVKILAPYTRIITEEAATPEADASAEVVSKLKSTVTAKPKRKAVEPVAGVADDGFVDPNAAAEPEEKAPFVAKVNRITAQAKAAEDAAKPAERPAPRRTPRDDAPF